MILRDCFTTLLLNLIADKSMKPFFFFIAFLSFTGFSQGQIDARIVQYPDVSSSHITFSYGGDIWIVPKSGGLASRLTSAKGEETFPKFSPDGSKIAFSGNYSGNVDVFVMPSQGGMPVRITYHGMADQVTGWFPDGENLLFVSGRESEKQRYNQFYKISDRGGLPEKLPLPYGEFGSFSPDGESIAYTPRSRAFRTWKRYKGGMATDIFVFNLMNNQAENISNSEFNDEFPMWSDDQIYFLSDRGANQRNNIWVYHLDTKEIRQITHFNDFDIHFPSLGPEEIVFEAGGKVYLLNLETEKALEVPIQVTTDVATLMPRKENVSKMIQNAWLSHDGKRGLFEARGEIFSVPAEKGPVYNLTQSSGVAERYPSWSPNGKYIAYWSDRTGEYELTIRDMQNPSKEKRLTSYGAGYRYQTYWSPDSRYVAFVDKAMIIYVYDLTKEQTLRVDQQKYLYQGDLEALMLSWSPDSRYLAFEKNISTNSNALAIYDVKEQQLKNVTSGFYNDQNPVFDPEGKYLYFLTNRSFSPIYSDFEASWVYAGSTQIAAIPLQKSTFSPLAPENDSTAVGEEKNEKDEDKEKEEQSDDILPVLIDWEGMERRIAVLPPSAGNYTSLAAAKEKVIYLKNPVRSDGETGRLLYFDLKERKEKEIMGKVDGYVLSADGEKILVHSGGDFAVIEVAEEQKIEEKMPVGKMEMELVPKQEWKQLFTEAWRLERDFFYDPNMHGVNWEAMREHYGSLLDHAVTRWDINYIIGELIGEISASHTYRGGGDAEQAPRKDVGYLGIDWGIKEGAYYVKRKVKGAPWDELRSPLDESGVNVEEGDFILAVNQIPLDTDKEPWAAFDGLAEETIALTVNGQPALEGARMVLVKTLSDESRLRNLEWIESNRKRVEEASDGRIGYIYVPSTGLDGQYELARMFYAQFEKEGLIIDERFNNGGQIPDRFIELLDRKPLAYWAVRDGETWQWPQTAHFGPKVMLINGWSGSGGDAFPDYFRKSDLGPLIGTRTWGGLIGITGSPALIDGGTVTVPTFRMFDPDGEWFKEGHGVDPDIEIPEDPSKLADGVDIQLERAIEEALRLLKEQDHVRPKVPAYEQK